MSRNGTGTYTLPAGNPVVTGTTISSTWANNSLSDIATALTQSLAKDGQTVPTANIPMGGFKITGLGAPTTAGDALAFGSPMGAISGTTGTFSGNVQMASQNGGQLAGLRNKIINGDFTVNQRGWTSATPATGAFTLDRWFAIQSVASKYSLATGAANAAAAAAGASGSLVTITSLSPYSVLTSDTYHIAQRVEGYNIADLLWGSANAKTVTLSFLVTSTLTGTFGGSIRNGASTRSYAFTYSIPVANTWTRIAVTIPGDTAGAFTDWLTTTGIGLAVTFGLGTGSTSSTTAGAWVVGNYTSATGAVSVVGTNAATWTIANVQLEVGPVATPFEQRPIGMELALCQRYYQVGFPGWGTFFGANNVQLYAAFPVTMRTTPGVTIFSGTSVTINIAGVGATTIATPTLAALGAYGATVYGATAASSTIGNGCNFAGNIQASAEL